MMNGIQVQRYLRPVNAASPGCIFLQGFTHQKTQLRLTHGSCNYGRGVLIIIILGVGASFLLLLATISKKTVRDRVKLTACRCMHPTWFSLRTRANRKQHHTTAVKSATRTINSLKLQSLDATY